MKQIKWFIKNLFIFLIQQILTLIIKRDKHLIIIDARLAFKNDYFAHNTKYLFLYLNETKNMQCVFLCDNSDIRNKMLKIGLKNVYSRKSLCGFYNALKGKYYVYDWNACNISPILSYKAIKINLWHGIPLKKIEYDANIYNKQDQLNKISKMIYDYFNVTNDYYCVNGQYEKEHYLTAFRTTINTMKCLGSPRLDVLFHDVQHSDLFMEKDFCNIKFFKKNGKKLFIYMPTFRDTGKDISKWLKSDKLKEFLKYNNAVLICKLHPADINSLDFNLSDDFYKMDSNSDVYSILKHTDALITDYSSIAFDYLLLNKPIIYHVPDLEEYQNMCRGFYMPFKDFAVGKITTNNEEIIEAMQDVINGIDNYKEERKILRDKMFKYQDGKNCERVVEWIKSLNEKGE